MIWVYDANRCQPILRLVIGDGMAASDQRACLAHFLRAAAQNLGQNVWIEVIGEANQIQAEERLATHGVDVAERVGGGDGPEGIGVVHHRRKEIRRGDDCLVVVQAIDGGIIGVAQPHEQVGAASAPNVAASGRNTCARALSPSWPLNQRSLPASSGVSFCRAPCDLLLCW